MCWLPAKNLPGGGTRASLWYSCPVGLIYAMGWCLLQVSMLPCFWIRSLPDLSVLGVWAQTQLGLTKRNMSSTKIWTPCWTRSLNLSALDREVKGLGRGRTVHVNLIVAKGVDCSREHLLTIHYLLSFVRSFFLTSSLPSLFTYLYFWLHCTISTVKTPSLNHWTAREFLSLSFLVKDAWLNPGWQCGCCISQGSSYFGCEADYPKALQFKKTIVYVWRVVLLAAVGQEFGWGTWKWLVLVRDVWATSSARGWDHLGHLHLASRGSPSILREARLPPWQPRAPKARAPSANLVKPASSFLFKDF